MGSLWLPVEPDCQTDLSYKEFMSTIWAIADLHLSFGVPNKEMDVFGPQWVGYTQKLKEHWHSLISSDDLVLIPGDISWAMHPEEAKADLDWIHALPGTKLLLKGNHDYWWSSLSKVEKVLPPSLHLLQNNAFNWKGVSIGGTRLWDTPEYAFREFIDYKENPREKPLTETARDPEETEKVFQRELSRLEVSLKCLDKNASARIAMTHYPPIGADLKDSRASLLLERYNIQACVFGHLHNVKKAIPLFGSKNGVQYTLTACDYLNFVPFKVL